jgi:hypothetical protein
LSFQIRRLLVVTLVGACTATTPKQGSDKELSGSSANASVDGAMDASPGSGGPSSNPPMKPQGETPKEESFVDGAPRSCAADADCKGSFSHCTKDVPNEVGLCTRPCADSLDCGDKGMWACVNATWDLKTNETRAQCALACVFNVDCPRGMSCQQNNFCGTPCSGNNCAKLECPSHAALECMGSAVYWMDGCGMPESVAHVCTQDEVCLLGGCFATGTTLPPPPPASTGSAACSGASARRCIGGSTVGVIDACGDVISTSECTGGTQCSAGACECVASSQTRCTGGKRWRLDSCGALDAYLGPC